MIIKVKEKEENFIVYRYDSQKNKVKKENIMRSDIKNILNEDITDIKLIEEEYEKYKKMLKNKFYIKYVSFLMLLYISVIPIVGNLLDILHVYLGITIGAYLINNISKNYLNNKIIKKTEIFNKKLLYEKNKEVCKKIEKNKTFSNEYDGSLLGIYFKEDYQILKEIRKYNEKSIENNCIDYHIVSFYNCGTQLQKRLVHKKK